MLLPLNFETTFYSLEKLISITSSPGAFLSTAIFKKIMQGKIMLDSLRLIPLSTSVYAVYDKTTCVIDDEARPECFSYHKIIKNVVLYNPYQYDKSLSVLQKMLKTPQDPSLYQAISITWIYRLPETPFFKTIVKLQMLCLRFKTLFPKIVPSIYDLLIIYTEKKLKIYTIFEKLSLNRVTAELTYVINYKGFKAHIHELVLFANTLFKDKLSHGDLASSNLILKKQGGIKCLLDFDTASSLNILPGRYIKNWSNDILDIINACLFYQIKNNKHVTVPVLTVEMTDDDYRLYEKVFVGLEKLYWELKETLQKYAFISDTTQIEKQELTSFLEVADPKKIFFNYI